MDAPEQSFDSASINVALVRRLIDAQCPQWRHLPLRPSENSGWDNRTFRLGESLSVRLPSAERYAPQVKKEQQWLPWLADRLPLSIPQLAAQGSPAFDYPWSWSVYHWLPGNIATPDNIRDTTRFAEQLGGFLRALHRVETEGAPVPGEHNFFRGGHLSVYDDETQTALTQLHGVIDTRTADALWKRAIATQWQAAPVWVHGDVAPGNLLVQNETLSAVIDFGCCGAGDPACDLAPTWTMFRGKSRRAFIGATGLAGDVWIRAAGWVLWKALITLESANERTAQLQQLIDDLLSTNFHAI